MSLYRQQGGLGPRWIVLAAALALLIGAAIGFAVGRSTAPDPTVAETVAAVREEVQPVLDGIALVPDHYAQSVRAGEVAEPVQYEGAVQQLATARDGLAAAGADLRALDPGAYAAAEDAMAALSDAVRAKVDPARIAALAKQAEAAVVAASGQAADPGG